MMRYLLLLFPLLFTFKSWSQDLIKTKGDRFLLTKEEMSVEAVRTTKMLFNSINRAIAMGRDRIPLTEAREEIDRIMNLFESNATMQESRCQNGTEFRGKPKPMKGYLLAQYNKAFNKFFIIEFEEPKVISVNNFEYIVKVKFWQKYESKTYDDMTLKGVVIRFYPLGDNRYEVKVVRVEVLQTICD